MHSWIQRLLVALLLLASAPTAWATLSANSRLDQNLQDARFLRVEFSASGELHQDSSGSCGWMPAECSVAPSSGLNILNPEFTPNGARVLQNLTNQVNGGLASDLSRATSVLSREEMLSAAGNPGIARMQYGNAVERLVGREITSDPMLRSLYQPVGGANNPDFIGRGLFQGQNFDITTPAQIEAHLARPGYGQGLNVITYERPPGF